MVSIDHSFGMPATVFSDIYADPGEIRIQIFGGRDLDARECEKKLDSMNVEGIVRKFLKRSRPLLTVISGGAPGADRAGENWARKHRLPLRVIRAEWEVYGRKRAGRIRNERIMNDFSPDLGVMFRGGPGTNHMFSLYVKNDLPVLDMDRESLLIFRNRELSGSIQIRM